MSIARKTSQPVINTVIDDVKMWIENNIEQEITTALVLSRTGYSGWYFRKQFQLKTGTSLSNFILQVKMKSAQYDILNNDNTFTDIAIKYGFNSLETFSRAFQRINKMPPSEIRKTHLKNQEI